MECKHENKLRLYERGKSWTSTTLYKCQDCGEIIKIGFEKVEPKTMQKPIREKTQDAFQDKEVRSKFGTRKE